MLSGSLVAYAVSTVVCYLMSVRSKQDFDFSTIKDRVGDFDPVETIKSDSDDISQPASREQEIGDFYGVFFG